MIILLYIIGWILCGCAAVFGIGLCERFFGGNSEDCEPIFFFGPVGLAIVILCLCIATIATYGIPKINFLNKILRMGAGK